MISPTRVLKIESASDEVQAVDEAALILRRGGLVAFPTETVYGLGADATNPMAVARIFEAKGRPASNPLIVHVSDVAMARSCVASWPDQAQALADRFWPGPLTLVLPRSNIIPDIVTAGRETVGVRLPSPRLVRALIERTGRPIAAPSANRSTGISPTTAEHVRKDLEGKVDLILDGGPTHLGIESTVVDVHVSPPCILRPGPISAEDLARALGGVQPVELTPSGSSPIGPASSPGQMAVHYAPRTRAIRLEAPQLDRFPWKDSTALLVVGELTPPAIPEGVTRQVVLNTPERAASELYRVLHDFDECGVEQIVVVMPPDQSDWRAIRDRLRRATRPWLEEDCGTSSR